jgi:hypothetical protein
VHHEQSRPRTAGTLREQFGSAGFGRFQQRPNSLGEDPALFVLEGEIRATPRSGEEDRA